MRRLAWIAAALLVLLSSCTPTSHSPQPRTVDRLLDLPTVVLSAQNPNARFSFSLEMADADETYEARLFCSNRDALATSVSVEVLRPDQPPAPVATDGWGCTGPACLGHYEVVARWKTGGHDTFDFSCRVKVTASSPPPAYPEPVISDLITEANVVVLAEGTISDHQRSWVAIRAPEGTQSDGRLQIEFERGSHPASIATDAETETLNTTAGNSFPVTMPGFCARGPCGLALTIETIHNDRWLNGRSDWRLVDYDHRAEPIQIEQRDERVPYVEGWGGASFIDIEPGEQVTATATVSVPDSLLEGMDPLRPVRLEIEEPDGALTAQLILGGDPVDHIVLTCDVAAPCAITFEIELIATAEADLSQAGFGFTTRTYLPHFVRAPSITPIAEVSL